jgi:hypothetical protein
MAVAIRASGSRSGNVAVMFSRLELSGEIRQTPKSTKGGLQVLLVRFELFPILKDLEDNADGTITISVTTASNEIVDDPY